MSRALPTVKSSQPPPNFFSLSRSSKEPIPPAAIKPVCDRFQDAAIVTFESEDPACMLSASVSWGASQAALCEPVIVAPYEPGHYALLIEGLDSGTYYNVKMSIVSDSGLTGTAATSNFITSRKKLDHHHVMHTNEGICHYHCISCI